MRALVVEDLAELVEPTLLRSLIGCRRIGGFLLEGQVHSLVATVLIRSTRLDVLRLDPRLDQPRPGSRPIFLQFLRLTVRASQSKSLIC